MGELLDAPNQQVVRADGSGPAEEGTGGSGPAEEGTGGSAATEAPAPAGLEETQVLEPPAEAEGE